MQANEVAEKIIAYIEARSNKLSAKAATMKAGTAKDSYSDAAAELKIVALDIRNGRYR